MRIFSGYGKSNTRGVTKALASAVGAFIALHGAPAWAGVVDPQIFVQQSGTSPVGGDPNIISTPSSFVVGVAGNKILQSPLLLVVAVYNGNGTPTVSFGGGFTALSPPGPYGLSATTGTFTSSTSGDAFSVLGLSAGGSENWTNWSGFETSHGLAAPSKFSLYAFGLTASVSTASPVTVGVSGVADGSFVIAYDCEAGAIGGTNGACSTPGDIGQTVFTDTGALNGGGTLTGGNSSAIPEPGTAALVLMGLLGLAGLRWRRVRA